MAKILLAIDNSEHSVRALDFYIEHIRSPDDDLVLVHINEIPYHLTFNYPVRAEVAQHMLDEAKASGREAEDKFKQILEQKQIAFRVVSRFGNPGEAVVTVAKDEGVAMILMGTRGMGKVRRTILGSVSDYVVHHAHCPVIITRHVA